MGLDTTHGCFHGPYSSFGRFRKSLAAQIGINLDDYIGYNEKGTKELDSIKHDIMPLLNHSDCDGYITPKQALKIANGLDLILKNIDKSIEFDHDFELKIIRFRDGCLKAGDKKERIYFE